MGVVQISYPLLDGRAARRAGHQPVRLGGLALSPPQGLVEASVDPASHLSPVAQRDDFENQ